MCIEHRQVDAQTPLSKYSPKDARHTPGRPAKRRGIDRIHAGASAAFRDGVCPAGFRLDCFCAGNRSASRPGSRSHRYYAYGIANGNRGMPYGYGERHCSAEWAGISARHCRPCVHQSELLPATSAGNDDSRHQRFDVKQWECPGQYHAGFGQ